MGSLESGGVPKRAAPRPFLHRPRSRLARFLLSEKVDYFQWICTVVAFFLVVILFQAFLPGSMVEKSSRSSERGLVDRELLKELGDLDFGEGIKFVPGKLLERFERERREANSSSLGRPVTRFGLRRPQLALVVPDLEPDAMQLEMVSIALALRELGYDIQVYSFVDGSVHSVWRTVGMPVSVLPIMEKPEVTIDWLNYNGILLNSIAARPIVSCLMQDPFKSVPVIWTIHEKSLALRQSSYAMNGQGQLVIEWKQIFSRATAVIFPTHLLPMMYSAFDSGNYFVIPGSPAEAWEAAKVISLDNRNDLRVNMGYSSEDFLIVIVGSQFSYSGMWLEHALVLQALAPLLQVFPSGNHSYSLLKIRILSEKSSSTYKPALETIAQKFGYPNGSVELVVDEGVSSFLDVANLIIYGSFLEEHSFPPVLLQAMCLGKLVIAPDLGMIRKYIDDRLNGYLFPKENVGILIQILLEVVSNGKISLLAQKIASVGKEHAQNIMVSETIEGYASLLENVLMFPSEVAHPKVVAEIPVRLKEEWQWHLFEDITNTNNMNMNSRSHMILENLEKQWNCTHLNSSVNSSSKVDEAFFPIAWEEEKMIEMVNARKRLEEEELKDRTDQPHGTWEEVYRNVKKADRAKNELHERDDRELERTGQPLCIYEPYFGEGTWPFLHNTSLYRGVGLSFKGRRPGADDIDASSQLPLLNNTYYRDVLGEFGAFFSLANRIDRIHKNAWIGFQSWRAAARKASLSKKAESSLLEAIQAHRHGDALYFWVRMDKDPRNPLQQDFWSFCDAINAGNCRVVVSQSLQRMYGVEHDWNSLPPMPMDGDTWSVMHTWALPTKSFLEFVMFSRMFVDALDAHMYDEHHESGHCYLCLSKDPHCYSRVLELLINVWAYHSARRMVYVNPVSGAMQEQHRFKSRRGEMWIRWFSFPTLKSMDEELAEEADSDHPDRRWLWPSTGEVFWQGVYERERNMRHEQKERRKRQSKDKIRRIRKRARQKTLGRYVKPPGEETANSNTTAEA